MERTSIAYDDALERTNYSHMLLVAFTAIQSPETYSTVGIGERMAGATCPLVTSHTDDADDGEHEGVGLNPQVDWGTRGRCKARCGIPKWVHHVGGGGGGRDIHHIHHE